jgi:hypothetical protein
MTEDDVVALAELLRPLLDEHAEVPWGVLAGGPVSYARWIAEQLIEAGVRLERQAVSPAFLICKPSHPADLAAALRAGRAENECPLHPGVSRRPDGQTLFTPLW